MDTIILPSNATFYNSLVDAVNHIYDIVPNINNKEIFQDLLPLKARIDDCYRDHEDKYIQEKQIAAIKAATSKFCVITAVNKSKADLAFSCPLLHQCRMLKMHIDGKDVDTAYDDDDKVVNSFTNMKDQIAYSWLPIPFKSNEFGAADIISKDSIFAGEEPSCGFLFHTCK